MQNSRYSALGIQHSAMTLLTIAIRLVVTIALFWVATRLRTPLFAEERSWAFWLVLALSVGLVIAEWVIFKPHRKRNQLLNFVILSIAVLGLLTTVGSELKFLWIKQSVLNADSQKLEKLGQHVMVGYRNFAEVKTLVERRAIAGVFITARNIQNQTKETIRSEIQTLQNIRRDQGLSPLWIASDQEGGIVSRLSPPLTHLPALATISPKQSEVVHYARIHGQELAAVGVNLNFAPVVDLNKGVINSQDKFSRIYQRAISGDPAVVSKVALWYCQTLQEYGVHCTAKHFPGLGSVQTDTHLDSAELSKPVSALIKEDWVPFRELMNHTQAFVMLGHAKLTTIDPTHPVSFSEPVIADLIRNSWKYNGVLITDGFCMQAIYSSADRLQNASVKALNAGVDLILLSFDSDLYYETMDALLQADKINHLSNEQLKSSSRRLERSKAS